MDARASFVLDMSLMSLPKRIPGRSVFSPTHNDPGLYVTGEAESIVAVLISVHGIVGLGVGALEKRIPVGAVRFMACLAFLAGDRGFMA